VLDGAEALAIRTGAVLGQGLGLLIEQGGEGALEHALGGGLGGLLQGEEVGVQGRPLIAESPAGSNLSPLSGEITEMLEFLGGQRSGGHAVSCLGLAPRNETGWSAPFYDKVLPLAKPVLTSWPRRPSTGL
jgi:hypothetical protein